MGVDGVGVCGGVGAGVDGFDDACCTVVCICCKS